MIDVILREHRADRNVRNAGGGETRFLEHQRHFPEHITWPNLIGHLFLAVAIDQGLHVARFDQIGSVRSVVLVEDHGAFLKHTEF